MNKNQTNFDPYDEKYYQMEQTHKAEVAKFNLETDWLEFMPEAKEYIVTKTVEIGKQIAILKNNWEQHTKSIAIDSQGNELEARLILIDALYSAEINKLASQLQILAKEANSHLYKTISIEKDSPRRSYTPDEIESARHIPLVDLFEADGCILKRSGRNFMTLCPFHDEKTPSCCIYPDDNCYHCFGCQAHGNSIDYLMQKNNLSFLEVMETVVGE